MGRSGGESLERDRGGRSRDRSSSSKCRRDDDTESRHQREDNDKDGKVPRGDRKSSSRDRSNDDRKRSRKDGDSSDHSLEHRSKRRDKGNDDNNDRHRRKRDKKGNRDEEDHRRRHRISKSSKDKKKRAKSSSKRRKKSSKSYSSSSSDSTSSDSSSSTSSSSSEEGTAVRTKKVVNKKLLEKLAARGETLEEWRERKSQKRATKIATQFGYTAEENPFNDPNLHETFTWKKKEEKVAANKDGSKPANKADHVFEEIEKVRKRRKDRELQFEELERIRAEESRMKELENYDEWARKEEEFHLQQQRQRSAIRLVEGREKPIDVLAKNLLLFGLTDEDRTNRGAVKYQERYNAFDALESLEAELEEPQNLLKELKLNELEELMVDIHAFMTLEREASSTTLHAVEENPVLQYWQSLRVVAEDEIEFLKSGGAKGSHAKMVEDVQKIFQGQSNAALVKMKAEVQEKLRKGKTGTAFGADESRDREYWQSVLSQLSVHLAKLELSQLHSKMLVCQLEKLEQKKEELTKRTEEVRLEKQDDDGDAVNEQSQNMVPTNVAPDFGNLEEELGLTDEINLHAEHYSWQDKYRPRKPRYFNRVKTGYDWNKYNQTHYDHDNPPPKIVQGYKFNIFYPDLIDPSKTPQYTLEPADSDEFCILRFRAGPPYEDIAFKIINREWNRSRKRGFRSTFERGVLSLYFNFTTHWYRR